MEFCAGETETSPIPLAPGTGERLCSGSSGFPRFLVPDDGIEDGEELSGDGDGGDDFGFSGVDELLVEGPQGRVEAGGGHGPGKEDGAHGAAPAANEAFALPFAGLAGPGGEAGKSGDFAPVEGSEFGHLGEQGPGDDRADA